MDETKQFQDAMDRGKSKAAQLVWSNPCTEFKCAASLDVASAVARFQTGLSYYRWSQSAKPTTADLAVGYGWIRIHCERTPKEVCQTQAPLARRNFLASRLAVKTASIEITKSRFSDTLF